MKDGRGSESTLNGDPSSPWVLLPGSIADPGWSLPVERRLENFKEDVTKLRDPLVQGSPEFLAQLDRQQKDMSFRVRMVWFKTCSFSFIN